MSSQVLEVSNLSVQFGNQPILRDISFTLGAGECIAIVGPNGSGKTTLLRAISGLVKPLEGARILLTDRDIGSAPPWLRTRLGLVHVLEGGRVFPSMTVEENIVVGWRGGARKRAERTEAVFQLFPFFADPKVRHQLAGTLSGGERVMLVLARATMRDASVLLLDSPFIGAGPKFRETVLTVIKQWQGRTKIGILIVDHDLGMVRRVGDRLYSLAGGALEPVTNF